MDKFTYLRYLLDKPVKKVIAGFSLTEANYEAAVDLLKQRFAKPVVIKRSHINELMNLQPVYKEHDLDRLRHFYDMAETHFRGLDSMMVDETTYSCVVVPLLLDKLPEAVRLSMLRAVKGAEDLSLSCFLEVLRNELEVRESPVSILKPNLAGSPGMQTMSASGEGKYWVRTSSALHSVAKDH